MSRRAESVVHSALTAFHSFPSTLQWDAYSSDYGPNFLGHALNSATYIVHHPEFGWLSFGGNLGLHEGKVVVKPADALRQHVYIASIGLDLNLDAGRFESVSLDLATQNVEIQLSPADAFTPRALLRIDARAANPNHPPTSWSPELPQERGAFVIPLGPQSTTIVLKSTVGAR